MEACPTQNPLRSKAGVRPTLSRARNPRKNDHALDRMAASIEEFGFKIPILARSNGEVVDGHLRLKAA
jgi:ParB-like chromosome segregation protein Spo0J